MKKSIFVLFAFIVMFASCTKAYQKNTHLDDFDLDYDFTYTLRQVLQYDVANPGGVNLYEEYDFFKDDSFNVKFYVENGEISFIEFDNGNIPFSVLNYEFPTGKVPCYYDKRDVPPSLRLSTGEKIADFKSGEFIMEFQLDCSDISYKYNFKTVNSSRDNK